MIATTRYKNQIAAILAYVEMNQASEHATQAVKDLDPRNASQIKAAADALDRRDIANAAWTKIPSKRRSLAATSYDLAMVAANAALELGGHYSGDTYNSTIWGDIASATTMQSGGDKYSKSCLWRKTDATHQITLHGAGIPAMVNNPDLCAASLADGLPVIALYCIPRTFGVWHATWVTNGRGGKTIKPEIGWIAYDQYHNLAYHSTISAKDASSGLQVKRDAQIRAELERNSRFPASAAERKNERRARLVVKLCTGLKATVKDAQSLGYCDPGIAAFKARFGIGDIASLPELVRTGDPSAIKLALYIARKATSNKRSGKRSQTKRSKAA